MKNIYRILSIILAVTIASAALPFSAFSAEETYLVYATASPLDGSGGVISGEDKYAPGEQVTVSIAPNTDGGYCAAQWGLSDIGEGVISAVHGKTSHTFTMSDRNVQISITFVRHSYIAYSDLKDGTHQNKCFYCGTENGAPEEHIDAHGGGNGTTPSDGYCDLCSASLHTHSYSSDWSSDEEGHYHSCECGATSDFAEHTSSGEATEAAAEVCTVCGYELSPQLEHTHSFSSEFSQGLSGHWHECECGAITDFVPHISSGAPTEDKAEVCTVCGYEISPKLTHTHSYSSSWSSDGDKHWHECSCGAINESSRQSHEKYAPGFSEEVHWWRCLECNYYFLDPEPHTMELRHDSLLLDAFGIYGHRWACTYCAYNLETEDCTIAWEYDNTYHWGDCTKCGYGKSKAAHDGERSCATCGWSFARSAPTGLRWDTSNGTVAVWDAVNGATNYIVELWKKDIISFRLVSHVVSDTSFDFDLTSLSPRSYYFTVRATLDDIESKSATSDNIIMTSGGTPILFNGSSERVDYIDGTAFIVDREDIADGSISEVDMTPIKNTTTLTEEQAKELIDEMLASYGPDEEVFKSFVISVLADYSLDEIKLIRKNIENDEIRKGVLIDIIDEEIESREATDLVIAPRYIDSTSAFKVTTSQGLGVTYSNDALKALLDSVGTGSNIKVATKFEKAEITKDEAKIIVAEWAEIVNTAEGEEQIKTLLTNYSVYELALLHQCTNILDLDDSTAQKLFELIKVEREKKIEGAGAKDNEEPLAKFSVNTYAVAADGTQTYIPVQKSMQYTIPVDTSSIPENATLALYRINADGTRTKQEILSAVNNLVIAQTDGNSDYILVYELAEEHTHSGGSATCTEKAICEICGTEYGEVLGHDFRGIGMDENEHWSKCKRCDATGEKQAHTIDGGLCTVCEYQPIKDGLSTDTVVAIAVAAIAVLVCGVCIFVFKKKK